MTSAPGKFDFADAKVLSLADVIEQVATDPAFPEARRATVRSSLTRLALWSGRHAESIAFAEPVIEALLDRLRADVLGISAKRLANARSDVRFVLDRYTTSGRYLVPFSPAVELLW